MENNDDLMSIVVLEAGATWPAWLTEYQRLAPNAVVVAQAAADTAEAFRSRVVHRIQEATTRGESRVRVGVIVAASSSDPGQLGMREGVASAILKAMGSEAEAELVLASDGGDEADPLRQELFTLAGSLCQGLGGTALSVRVRFSGKSGVMRTVAASSPDLEALVTKGHA